MEKNTLSNVQRALWMVLITSLVAPFFMGLIAVALALVSSATGFTLPFMGEETLGEAGIDAFVWSAFPATVAALGLTPFVLQHGTYTWLEASVAGVLAFAAGAVIFPFSAGGALPLLAFAAGLVAIGLRAMLIMGGVLREAPQS